MTRCKSSANANTCIGLEHSAEDAHWPASTPGHSEVRVARQGFGPGVEAIDLDTVALEQQGVLGRLWFGVRVLILS